MRNKITPQEIERLDSKDKEYWSTIERRKVFRNFRWSLNNLDLFMPIPFNHPRFTDKYCKAYGNKDIELLQEDPFPWVRKQDEG